MKNFVSERSIATTRHFDVVDVTPEVEEALESSGIRNGHVTILTRDAGCSLMVNEKETGLIGDIRDAMARSGDGDSTGLPVGSTSVMLPAIDGALAVGTWQRVLLIELDSEGSRTVVVQIVGD